MNFTQVLSEEDDNSPILSFSNGTLIGEACCLLFHRSTVILRCATYCEVQTLDTANFYKCLLTYPNRTKHFRTILKTRIRKAKLGLKIVERNFILKKHSLAPPQTTMKCLKGKWRSLLATQKDAKKVVELEGNVDGVHTSEFLNMLVLSDDVDLKLEAVFLTKNFPFILDPDSSVAAVWQYLMYVAVLLMVMILPLYVCFGYRSEEIREVLVILDLMFILDVYIRICTAIKLKQQTVTKLSHIVLRRCKDITFIVDVIAALPIDYYMQYFTSIPILFVLNLKLLRLLKIYKIMVLLFNINQVNWNYPVLMRALKYTFLCIICIYFMAALIYSIKCLKQSECDYRVSTSSQPASANLDTFGNVIQSIYYIGTFFFGAHNTRQMSSSVLIAIFNYSVALAGYMMISFCFSEFCALYLLQMKHEANFHEKIVALRYYLYHLNVPNAIINTLHDYLNFMWKFNKDVLVMGRNSIMNDASSAIKNEVIRDRTLNILRTIPIFEGLSEHLLNQLYNQITIHVVPPNFEVSKYEDKILFLRIISRGFCRMHSALPMDKAFKRSRILKVGESFPVLEGLHKIPSFIHVMTVTAVELLYIEVKGMIHILKSDTLEHTRMATALETHMQEYETLLRVKPCRLVPMIPGEKSLGRGEYFTYTIADDSDEEEVEDSKKKVNTQKFATALHYIMLPWTINPVSKFYITWECFVCVFACVRMTMCSLKWSLLASFKANYFSVMTAAEVFLDVFFMCDIYIRLHLQYYNKNGIFVTHYYYTALNYVKTNMPIDLLVIIPFHWLQVTKIFGRKNVYMTDVAMSIIFRPLQLYHVLGALSYFQVGTAMKKRSTIIKMAKTMIILLFILILFCNIFILSTCTYIEKEAKYKCPKSSWYRSTIFANDDSAASVFLMALYVSVTCFTTAITGAFTVNENRELILVFILTMAGVILRMHFVAAITSSGIGLSTTLTKFQQQISVFLKFVKTETVDEDLIQETVNHYEYMFKKTKGREFNHFLHMFHTTLKRNIGDIVFASSVREVQLFRNMEQSFYAHFSAEVNLTYFKKDTVIIRCNDVQQNLYIVHKGMVEISIARQKICILGTGGIFGNFHVGNTRQTITAFTKVHSELIILNCSTFHKLIRNFPTVMARVNHLISLQTEFWESKNQTARRSATNTENTSSVTEIHSSMTEVSVKLQQRNIFKRILMKTIAHNGQFYALWLQIMCFHVAAISSIIIMYFIFMAPRQLKPYFNILKYILDVLYLPKIYIGFHLSYINPDTGLVVNDLKIIGWKYFKGMFWLDLFTLLPLEVIGILLHIKTYIMMYLSVNRIFRFIFMIQYHQKIKYKLKVLAYIRWTYLIYWTTFTTQLLTCIWWISACQGWKCSYRAETDYSSTEFLFEQNPYISNLMAYHYVINLFTMAGFKSVCMRTMNQMYATIFIILVTQYLTALMARVVASHLVVKYSAMSDYEYQIQELKDYLKLRELSPSILKHMWQYLLDLWFRQNGQWMPIIIQKAPYYLKQDIMFSMYGMHLENHFLFSKTHVDFLRQLICHVTRCVFFPKNYIAEKHDVDACMYFIHSGEVEVYEVNGKNEILQRVLTKGMTFGEAQGLFNVPHILSYRANTVVDLLILKRGDWKDLLRWFPASKEQILLGARENLNHIPKNQRAYDFVH